MPAPPLQETVGSRLVRGPLTQTLTPVAYRPSEVLEVGLEHREHPISPLFDLQLDLEGSLPCATESLLCLSFRSPADLDIARLGGRSLPPSFKQPLDLSVCLGKCLVATRWT